MSASVIRLSRLRGRRRYRDRPASPDTYAVWRWDGGVGHSLSGSRFMSKELATALAKRFSKELGTSFEVPTT